MESLYAQCMRERYGRGVIERPFGYLTYFIEGKSCSAVEIYIRPEDRGAGNGKALWEELRKLCKEAGVVRIHGFVDTALPGADVRLKAYLQHGAALKEVAQGVIILEWEV